MLQPSLLLFIWSFGYFTLYSRLNYSSASYHLSGQVIQVSLRQSDSLIALYPLFILFLDC